MKTCKFPIPVIIWKVNSKLYVKYEHNNLKNFQKSILHFEAFLLYGVRKCSNLIFLHVAVLFFQHHFFLIDPCPLAYTQAIISLILYIHNCICLFIFGCAGSLLLGGLFSSCGEWGLLCSCSVQALAVEAFLVAERGLQGTWASVVLACGLSSCSSQALEHQLSSCGIWAQLLCSIWDLPRSRIKPTFPVLAGRFCTTEPQGQPQHHLLKILSFPHCIFLPPLSQVNYISA